MRKTKRYYLLLIILLHLTQLVYAHECPSTQQVIAWLEGTEFHQQPTRAIQELDTYFISYNGNEHDIFVNDKGQYRLEKIMLSQKIIYPSDDKIKLFGNQSTSGNPGLIDSSTNKQLFNIDVGNFLSELEFVRSTPTRCLYKSKYYNNMKENISSGTNITIETRVIVWLINTNEENGCVLALPDNLCL